MKKILLLIDQVPKRPHHHRTGQIETITSRVNEISETMANTSSNDPSDDNFPEGAFASDTSDVTDYFKEEEDSDANKSDSDVYFKFDDSDSDDEYDHELHERLQHKEMERLA